MPSKLLAVLFGLFLTLGFNAPAFADNYVIDTEGGHASINFKIRHLGFSWLTGRFDGFTGTFRYDPTAPDDSLVKIEIETASLNSNHAKRDKHLRGPEFLDVTKFPKASFRSTSIKSTGKGTADITGILILHGVNKQIVIKAHHVGGGGDPWGGHRQGFTGTTSLKLTDYGINFNLGPASTHVDMTLNIEGIRAKKAGGPGLLVP